MKSESKKIIQTSSYTGNLQQSRDMLVNRSVFVKYTEKYILWKNIGLHRDDGLSCFDNKSKPKLERIRKKIYKTLKDNCLNITIETNMDITDYLDITFN